MYLHLPVYPEGSDLKKTLGTAKVLISDASWDRHNLVSGIGMLVLKNTKNIFQK